MFRLLLPLAIVFAGFTLPAQNLTLTSQLPVKAATYEQFTVPVTVSNNGIVDAEKFFVHVVLSTDEIFDQANDHIIANGYLFLVEAGSSSEILMQTYILDAPAGTYNLLVIVDGYSDVIETDESDNVLIQPGFVVDPAQIDLTFSSLEIPSGIATIGDILDVDFSIGNIGTTSTAGAIWTAFFLSNDDTYDATDVFIGSYHAFLAEESADGSAELLMPDVPPGNYYLIGKTDGPTSSDRLSFEMYDELNEHNNLALASITLSAPNIDLTGGLISTASIYQDSPYKYSYTVSGMLSVKNAGTTLAGTLTYSGYLSSDLVLDENDRKISTWTSYSKIGPGSTNELYFTASDIMTLPVGPIFLLIHINSDGTIPETDKENNVLNYRIEVPAPVFYYVDLSAASIPYPIIAHDSQLNVALEYTNNSPGDFQNLEWTMYTLSNSSGLQIPLQYTSLYLFVPQSERRIFNHVINVTGDLPAGNYTLSIRSSRNEISLPVVVSNGHDLIGSVIGEDGGSINAGRVFLYKKNFEGKYRYQNSVTLASLNTFSFEINREDHILYFIPDPALYPDYVPTIYDNALLVPAAAVINASNDIAVNLSVLKVNAIDPGGRVINGNVSLPETEGGRVRNGADHISVILLDAGGKVVGLDYCDTEGNFELNNLPAGQYSIIIGGVGDNITLEPIAVNISTYEAMLNIDLTDNNVSVSKKFLQGLSLQPIMGKKFGDPDFVPPVTSMTPQSILLQSSNPAVATIEDGKIKILKAGSTLISARQEGNAEFKEAFVQGEMIVGKADQTIEFANIAERILGDAAFTLDASTNFQLPVIFTSHNAEVAIIHENTVEIVGVGETEITAAQPGNENILAASPVSQILKVHAVTGIDELPALIIYPNPTLGLVHISSQLSIDRIDAISSTGARHPIPYNENVIDLSHLSSGIYLLQISAREGSRRIRVVKE